MKRTIQVVLTTTCEFLRWMHPTRRMEEGVVTLEKFRSGTMEKMPGISKELNSLGNFRRDPKIRMREKLENLEK